MTTTNNLVVFDHPLIQHKLAIMRQAATGCKDFRELLTEITMLMGFELTRDMPLENYDVTTPLGKTTGKRIVGRKTCIIPILRAGLGMVDGLIKLIPVAKVGHIGIKRNELTLEPMQYYLNLPPDIADRQIIIVDPMLATGGSILRTIEILKSRQVKFIKVMCLIASPEGVRNIQDQYPEVQIYVAGMDKCLNQKGFIVPGLGDAGDRIFGTYEEM